MTNIYHIVYFKRDNSVYLFFKGCNFVCKGCIRKLSPWDCSIPNDVRLKLQSQGASETISLVKLSSFIKQLKVEKAILGGGEPTVDLELTSIVKLLNEHKVYTVLLTNGHNLDSHITRKLENVGLNEICVSIKAFTDSIHTYYTRISNRKLLENFKQLNEGRIKLRAESILIPGLIDKDEIERVAKFIASLNPTIPYRIDGYIKVHGTPWRGASPEEVREVAEVSRRYLENVSYLHANVPIVGEAKVVYPKV